MPIESHELDDEVQRHTEAPVGVSLSCFRRAGLSGIAGIARLSGLAGLAGLAGLIGFAGLAGLAGLAAWPNYAKEQMRAQSATQDGQ